MVWEVELIGDTADLDLLVENINEPDLFVTRSDGKVVLRSQEFENLGSEKVVRDRAAVLASRLSGSSRVLLKLQSSLDVGTVYEVTDSGGRSPYFFLGPAKVQVRSFPAMVGITNAGGVSHVSSPYDAVVKWADMF